MTLPDPAAAFTARLGDTNRLAHVPVQPARDVPGLLPDPRTDGPRWAITPPAYPDHHVQRSRGKSWLTANLAERVTSCPSPEYCAQNGCSANGCGYGGRRATAYFFDDAAAVPADPERYERARGWGRPYLAAGAVAMAGAALVIAYLALLPW